MRTYTQMKDSGVVWLGDIPAAWSASKVFAHYTRKRIKNHPNEELLSVYRDYGVIPKSSRDDNHNTESVDLSNYQLVEKNDLVTNKMKTWQGSIAVSNHRGIVSPAYYVMSPTSEGRVAPRFIHYLLRSPIYISQYRRLSKGIRPGQWDLEYDQFKRLELPLPDYETQERIANYLDEETALIDDLIAKQQRLLALLEEKRRATIINTITHGLNGVTLKDSGIEWLGEISQQWSIKPLFSFVQENKRSNKGMVNENVLTLSYGKIKVKNIDNGGLMPESFETYQIIMQGDIVLRLTDLQNDHKSLRVGYSEYEGIITSAYVSISSKIYFSKYLYYMLHAYDLMKVFYNLGGGLRQGMKYSDVKRLPAIEIEDAEQRRIIDFLEDYEKKVDKTFEKTRAQIELLKERRISLISNVVTGKVKI